MWAWHYSSREVVHVTCLKWDRSLLFLYLQTLDAAVLWQYCVRGTWHLMQMTGRASGATLYALPESSLHREGVYTYVCASLLSQLCEFDVYACSQHCPGRGDS